MASDIVFDQAGGDSISFQGARVLVTGRINLAQVQGGEKPPGDGEIGDLVMTIEEHWNPALRVGSSTARLWLCVPQPGATVERLGKPTWREVQLGAPVRGG